MHSLLKRSRDDAAAVPARPAVDEPSRLEALRRYNVLDSLPDSSFDDLTALTARLCDMPLAGITFIDENRLWFKSRVGFSTQECPREGSMCLATIEGDDLLIVDDARRDPRFASGPFVAGEPHLRFYAGIPIRTSDGFNIGTLWAADARKRRLGQQSRDALRIISHQVLAQLDLRRHVVELERSLFEHRRTQDALKNSELFYQTLVETLPQNILRKDTKGRFVFANRNFCASLGTAAGDVLGKTDWDFFPPQLAEKYHGDDLRVMATREPVDTIEANQMPGGEQRFVHVIKTPLFDGTGNVVGIQGIFWDVTERKKIEEALAYERDLLRALLENIPDRIYFKDVESRFLRVSTSMAGRLGVSDPREVMGKSDFNFYPRDLATEFYTDEQRIIATGQPLINKLERLVDRDGKESWASVTKVPLQNRAGGVVGIIGISRDVTKLKEAETALEQARDAALETARVKSEFLANMSHEIRTPMNAIVGMTDLLFDTTLNDEQREFVGTIRGSTETLLSIINDILDYSKLEAGKLVLENLEFDLRELVESTAEMLAQRAQSKGIELAYAIDADVPALLKGDAGRVGQVLANLLSNAVKFTDRGEVLIRVARQKPEAAASAGMVSLRISVTDTGIGISSATLSRIFQSFTQADGSTSRKYGGTGLGLSISKQLVEALGGRIGVESSVGTGSEFWFTLDFEVQPHQPEPRDPGDIRDARVLVVDDNATSQDVLAEQVRRWGLHPDIASPAEALERLKNASTTNQPFTFAIVGQQTTGTDGLRLAESIKLEPATAKTRVIIVAPLGNRPSDELMKTCGISGCVAKPVRQSRLFDAMVNAVHEREEASVTQRREARPPNTSVRILIAEDNLVNQRLAMRQLQKLGYTAEPVGNGFAVLEELKRNVYDVILMDCQMPELDGYEVTRRIRAWEAETRRPPVYIIAVTAHALEGDRERCVNAGMNDYITKPVHMAQLEAALNRALKPRAGAAAAAAAGATVLDPVCLAGLKELREPGQPDPLTELFDLFRRESARCVASLSESSGAHNAQGAAQAAHTLKGSASNLGATQLATLCAQTEQRARVADWDRVDQLIHQVEQELERVKTALAAEI